MTRKNTMQFRVGNRWYRVRICPGPLIVDGEPVEAQTHEDVILLCGLMGPRERIRALIDQLRRLHELSYGLLADESVTTFALAMVRRFGEQGGERRLIRMTAPTAAETKKEGRHG